MTLAAPLAIRLRQARIALTTVLVDRTGVATAGLRRVTLLHEALLHLLQQGLSFGHMQAELGQIQ